MCVVFYWKFLIVWVINLVNVEVCMGVFVLCLIIERCNL